MAVPPSDPLTKKTKRVKKFLNAGPLKKSMTGLDDPTGITPENMLILQDTTEQDVLHLAVHALANKLKRFAHILIVGGVPVYTNPVTHESFVLQSKTQTQTPGDYLTRLGDLITTLKDPQTQAINSDILTMKPMIRRYRDEDTGAEVTKYFAALVTDNDTEMVMEGVTIKQFDDPAPNANYPSHFMIADGYPVSENNVIVQTPVGTETAFATADLLRDTPSTEIDPQGFEKFPIETVALLVYPSGTTRVVKKGSYVVEVNDYVEHH